MGYMSDSGVAQKSPHGETKRRVYGEQRQFLGNYKPVVGTDDSLRNVIGGDSEDGISSGLHPNRNLVKNTINP